MRILVYEIVHCLLVEEALLTRVRLRERDRREREKLFYDETPSSRRDSSSAAKKAENAREKPKSRPAERTLDDVLEKVCKKERRKLEGGKF